MLENGLKIKNSKPKSSDKSGLFLYYCNKKYMLYVVLSILCSVCVGVVLKYAKQNNKSIAQIIATNYVAAFFLNQIIFKPTLFPKIETNIWAIVLFLGLLLPIVFIFQAKAIAYSGIVKTDIAQRLSLLLSLFCAFFFFHDTITFLKVLG